MSYVVLRPGLHITLSRATERGGTELKDIEAITGLHGAFAQLADLEDHAIDTVNLDAEQTAAEVRRLLVFRQVRAQVRSAHRGPSQAL